MTRVVKRETAKRDLDHYAAYMGKTSPESAIRFLEAAETCFKNLAKMPF